MFTIHSSPGMELIRRRSASARPGSRRRRIQATGEPGGPIFAALEPRLLMSASGDFAIREAGNNLTLRGDKFDNHLEITQIADHQYQFTGLNGTTIGGLDSIIRTFTGKLTILSGAGHDSVRIIESQFNKLAIDMGADHDELTLDGIRASQITLKGGKGNDAARITGSQFNKLTIDMGAGDDELTLGAIRASQINLTGGKGCDTLFDLGANDMARRVRGFEFDRFPIRIDDSFAAVSQMDTFNFLLRQGRAFTINETQTQRFITDYRIDSDLRGRVRVTPIHTDFITGLQGSLLAEVTPDRRQVTIDARLVQTVIESVNQLGVSTPAGMRYIDQPVLSTLSLDTILTLPDGETFAPGRAERAEGPILGEASIFLQPDIIDIAPEIARKDLKIDLTLGTLHRSANSQSLKSALAEQEFDNFSARMQFLAGDRVASKLSYTTQRLLGTGYQSARDALGNQTVNTFSSPFRTGLDLDFTSRINLHGGTLDLIIDSTNAMLTDVGRLPVQTAAGKKGRQFIQLPIIDSLRVQSRIVVPDGRTVILGDVVMPGSLNPRDNMQIAVTPRIVQLGGSALTELGVEFRSQPPDTDEARRISASLAAGTQTFLTGRTEQLLLTDIFSTFGPGGSGSMKTITSPLITGWNYNVQTAGSIGSRIAGQIDFTQITPEPIRLIPYGSRFGVQKIQQATITADSLNNKIPLIGDIPLLGGLFRNNDTKTRTSLIIMITPPLVNVDTRLD